MATFLDNLPRVPYDIAKGKTSNYQAVTNITFRLKILKEVVDNISAYVNYTITDTDTPEILAEKIYGNPEAYWIILYANDIFDPQYDWPMNYRVFNNYIVDKYGSLANAKTTIHHYEKVIEREVDGITSTFRYEVDYDSKTNSVINMSAVTGSFSNGEAVYQGANLTAATFSANVIYWNSSAGELTLGNTVGSLARYTTLTGNTSSANGTVGSYVSPSVPYDYYKSLPATQSVSTYSVNGKTVIETISRNSVSNYDWEEEQNEARRQIKVIKKEYYPRIALEFNEITGANDLSYVRKLG